MHNIALIGCGHMGRAHMEQIYARDDICIYGVSDRLESRAKQFAAQFAAKSYSTDYMTYIKDPAVNIIICAAYPSLYLNILKACVSYNKHLLCEKPIATNLKDGKEFVSIVKSSNIKVLVGYILRHNETYKRVADMIHSDYIGSPIVLRMTQNHHTMNWGKYLALINESSPIIDCGVHYIDLCRWFTGAEVEKISGISLTTEPDVPQNKYNYGMINMTLSDKSVAYYEVGWGKTFSSDNTKEFIGPKGRIKIVQKDQRISNREEGDLIEYYNKATGEYKSINIDCKSRPTGEELNHLIKMIKEDVPAVPSIDDVMSSFETAINADKIIKGGNTIC